MEHYKRVARNLVYNGQVIRVYEDKIEFPDGHTASWDYIEHAGGSAAVAVLDGKLLMVKQFRNAFDREMLELPAGGISPGEDPAACAVRELEEETGYHAEEASELVTIRTNVALSGEIIRIYLCTGLTKTERRLDSEENIEVLSLSLSEALSLIFKGEISDSKTVAGILTYAALRNNKEYESH